MLRRRGKITGGESIVGISARSVGVGVGRGILRLEMGRRTAVFNPRIAGIEGGHNDRIDRA